MGIIRYMIIRLLCISAGLFPCRRIIRLHRLRVIRIPVHPGLKRLLSPAVSVWLRGKIRRERSHILLVLRILHLSRIRHLHILRLTQL